MFNFIYDCIFTIATIYILIKSISYAIYEIKSENNKFGGVSIISFSVLVTLFANFIIWTK